MTLYFPQTHPFLKPTPVVWLQDGANQGRGLGSSSAMIQAVTSCPTSGGSLNHGAVQVALSPAVGMSL